MSNVKVDQLFLSIRKILLDGSWKFHNEEMTEFTESRGIYLKTIASDNPWGNGKCEKVVGLLKETMKK